MAWTNPTIPVGIKTQKTLGRSIHLPYAWWGSFNSPAHGDAAITEATAPPDELIGLLEDGLAGEC